MARLLFALALGLIGAAFAHITIILLVPLVSERDAWSRLAEAGDLLQTVRLDRPDPGQGALIPLDPLFAAAACRFDLSEGPVAIGAAGNVPFWSASVYDRAGRSLFSLTDRTAVPGQLDLTVGSADQLAHADSGTADDDSAIQVETDALEGMVVIRSFIPDPSWRPAVEAQLGAMACRRR